MRERIKQQLARIRARLRKLYPAERFRDGRTRHWKRVYRRARDRYGDQDKRTVRALRKYRASRKLSVQIDVSQSTLRRRAKKKLDWLEEHPPPLDPDGDGLISIDNKQVAEGVGREVLRIRAAGVWKGVVVSGYRTPEYSEQLCYGMCNAPSCPGMCAGRNTNHARKGDRNGAVDLTDYLTFASECERLDSWLENHLPRDLVHFSDAGV